MSICPEHPLSVRTRRCAALILPRWQTGTSTRLLAPTLVPALLLAVVLGLLLTARPVPAQPTGDGSAPLPAVVVAAVQMRPVEQTQRFTGNIKAIAAVDLRARVEGFLEEVAFEQGRTVEAGQLLYRIEQATYQAQLDSAKAQLAAAKAELDSAQAAQEQKQGDFERQQTLLARGDTSQAMFDQARAQRDEAAADVERARANQQQAQAAVKTAEINLGYTTIYSPIRGRIGATNYTAGNLVDPASGTLATVIQLDPIRAVFSIPSADFIRFMQQAGGDPDRARQQIESQVILPTGETYAHQGHINFADNQVDARTGTVAIFADFPNPDHLLLPGQFITAVVGSGSEQRLPAVPAAALQRTREGEQVFVVGTDNRVELRTITTAGRVGNDLAVSSGLTEGEIVVVSGMQRIRPGMEVKPVRDANAAPSAPEPASADANEPASAAATGEATGDATGDASGQTGEGATAAAPADAPEDQPAESTP